MSSRQELKAQRRAEREEQERRAAGAARQKQRLQRLGAVMVAAVIVVVAVVVIADAGGKDDKGLKTGQAATQTSTEVRRMFAGIPQSGTRLGNPSAPVTMEYYGDLQCPVCRDFSLGALPQTIDQQVRSGRMQIVYRSLETATQDPSTFATQQSAALAAGRQSKAWQYIELFYRQQSVENSGYVDDDFLDSLARQAGLDVSTWTQDRSSGDVTRQVTLDGDAATRHGANSTPTLRISGRHGTKTLVGNVPYSQVASAAKAVA